MRTDSLPTLAQVTIVTEDDVRRRAHAIYVARGGEHGHALDDWLQAERELRPGA